MRKFLFAAHLLALLMLAQTTSFGQITISTTTARSQIIALDPYNQCGIAKDETGFILFSSTNNMFDDAFILMLGPDKDGAQQTLKSLIDLVEIVKSQHVTFQSFVGDSYTASMIHNGLTLRTEGYIGEVFFAKSLLLWLNSQLDSPDGGPWNSINDAANAIGTPEMIAGGRARELFKKWGSAYLLNIFGNIIYLGNTKDDALATLKEYTSFSSAKDQVWPRIILNSRVTANVTNALELGARASYVQPSDGRKSFPLYYLNMKKYVKILEELHD